MRQAGRSAGCRIYAPRLPPDAARSGDLTLPSPAIELHGHRGARGLWPENTLAGFQGALSIGVTAIEMDVALTRDGVVILSHDPFLDPR